MPHIGGPQAPGPLAHNSQGDRADFAQIALKRVDGARRWFKQIKNKTLDYRKELKELDTIQVSWSTIKLGPDVGSK